MGASASGVTPRGRGGLRLVTAALAAAVGVLYFLIAAQVIVVADTSGKDSPMVPMALAGVAFLLGAVLVLLRHDRIVYVLGTVVQLAVIIGYFAVAPSRDPHYEVWGLTMKVAQLAMLGLLAYLAVTTPWRRQEGSSPRSPSQVQSGARSRAEGPSAVDLDEATSLRNQPTWRDDVEGRMGPKW